MNLTAGATLQNDKYVIQAILDQSGSGITCQAIHAYLNQIVILQTLDPALRQRSDFAQLHQQFFEGVRLLSHRLPEVTRVLDCFEEDGMPFVVLEAAYGNVPKLSDWLVLPSETAATEAELAQPVLAAPASDQPTSAETLLQVEPAETKLQDVFPETISLAAPEPLPAEAGFEADSLTATSTAETLPPAPALLEPELFPVADAVHVLQPSDYGQATAIASPQQRSPQKASKSKPWLPVTLTLTSLLGGLVGVGYGLTIRLNSVRGEAKNVHKATPSLFSREQSFPPGQDWPVTEAPSYKAPEQLVEQPVYRVSPPVTTYNVPEIQPLPNSAVESAPVSESDSVPKTVIPQKPALPPGLTDPTQPGNLVPDTTTDTNPAKAASQQPIPLSIDPVSPVSPASPEAPPPAPAAPEPMPPAPAADTSLPLAPAPLPNRKPSVINN
jgi:hypothetical protein